MVSRQRSILLVLVVILSVAAALAGLWWTNQDRVPAGAAKTVFARDTTSAILAKGEYLARAGDCIACHTQPGSREFAGGRAMETPFGSLFVPNITPDDEHGIGRWTPDEFYRMMHTGRSRDGTLLYPAMPFASYTKITREDSDAIFSYLLSVPPIAQPNRPHELRFPFNNRELLVGWRALYFKEGEYVPEPRQTTEWNRGAYLVQGLGHCAMCHTAINALGGSSQSKAFEGGMIPNQNWYAPSLTSNREAGLGEWSIDEIVNLLQGGVSHRGTVYGPMAEVVYNSLQYLTDEDVKAMAVYLKALPSPGEKPLPPTAQPVQPAVMELGRKIYSQQCAVCHKEDGKGYPPDYPPLANNQSIEMATPVNPIRMVLNGGYPPGTKRNPRPHGMPPFAHLLNDEDIAAVVTYIRVAWGNSGTPVTPAQANQMRSATVE